MTVITDATKPAVPPGVVRPPRWRRYVRRCAGQDQRRAFEGSSWRWAVLASWAAVSSASDPRPTGPWPNGAPGQGSRRKQDWQLGWWSTGRSATCTSRPTPSANSRLRGSAASWARAPRAKQVQSCLRGELHTRMAS